MGAQTGPDKGGTDEGNGALTSGADKHVWTSVREGWCGDERARGMVWEWA
jgi:hypothetical protein